MKYGMPGTSVRGKLQKSWQPSDRFVRFMETLMELMFVEVIQNSTVLPSKEQMYCSNTLEVIPDVTMLPSDNVYLYVLPNYLYVDIPTS